MAKNKANSSALKVNSGIEKPATVNVDYLENMRSLKSKLHDFTYYTKGIVEGDRNALAQAITLVESSKSEHRALAEEILQYCITIAKPSVRIGITGVPGVGKSTFIEAFGKYLTSIGHQVAVLAIDPSSSKHKGSILGDKTRMEMLSVDANAFIRPSPSSGSLGGVAQKTRETISLCEAAGFDVILVETVGVGQSEIAVHSMVDFFLLLMLAGAGDELQGIKRGIIEMSDALFVNKADGDNESKAEMSKVQYANALHLFPANDSGWVPVVDTCSAQYGIGIEKVWNTISDYIELTKSNQYFHKKRQQQELFRLHEQIDAKLKSQFYENSEIKALLKSAENKIVNTNASAYMLAEELMNFYQKKSNT